MAFGRPGKEAAFVYLGLAVGSLAVIVFAEPIWARVLCVITLFYSLFCFFITGAFSDLLFAIPSIRAALAWKRELSEATGGDPALGDQATHKYESAGGNRLFWSFAAATAVILLLGGMGLIIKRQHDDIARLRIQQQKVMAELEKLRLQAKADKSGNAGDHVTKFPVRLTANEANRPGDWPDTVNRLYDPKDTEQNNLERFNRLGGNAVRAEIERMKKREPPPTDKEILNALLRDWGGSKQH